MNHPSLSPDHPICNLSFLLVGKASAGIMKPFEALLGQLANRRAWVISPPQLVDYIDELGDGNEQHTYGAVLQIYSAFPPWDKQIPKSVDVSHFKEVSLIVDELCQFTRQFNCTFVLQLDQTQMGYIRNAEMDRSIRIGLIDEWKHALDRA